MRPPMNGSSSSNSSSDGDHQELKKGSWTPEEDQKLVDYINTHGQGSWQLLPKKAGLQRCGKSCRLRWTNYLRPDIKRGNFTPHEEQTIIHLHSVLGNKWSMIASRIPGRTDNEIKNYWNTHLRKRLIRSGIDPKTHQPIITYPMLPSPLNNTPLETLSKLKTLCNILQILQTTNQSPIPQITNPLGFPETLTTQFNGFANTTFAMNPQPASSSMLETILDDQPVFESFGTTMPELVDRESDGGMSKIVGSTSDEEMMCGNQLVTGTDDDLEQILNYKELFGSNKSCDDVWGEVIDGETSGGSSSCSWKDVLSDFFPDT